MQVELMQMKYKTEYENLLEFLRQHPPTDTLRNYTIQTPYRTNYSELFSNL